MPAGFYSPSSTPEPIVGIQICVFSPEEIERRSVVEITSQGTYEGNEPKIGGLFDPRMGVLDNGKTCRSCGQSNHNCPGHFGHYRLARPVYFIQFLPFVLNVLSCVCVRCSKLLIDKKQHTGLLKRRGEARWREVLASCKEINRCGQETEDGCGARQPNRYVREGIARIVAEWDNVEGPAAEGSMAVATPNKQRQPLEVEYVLRLFRRVTDEDVDFLGLNRFWCRPDWMICSVLPIPPPQVRPSVTQDNNQRSEDDLTHKLADIIKTNITLQQRIESGGDKKIVDEWTNVLQYHIATLVDNQIPGVAPSAQRNGRPLKSIQQRLGSKEGRIRYNIQGKRVEFSARSVITPDPNISIAELGVPEKIAMNLTRPERVTPYNREQLYKLVQNGPMRYPGAKTIVRKDGRMISLRHVNTKDLVLHYGDIVNRHLMDGDMVLFNRQPTLHRMSMMGHRVKVLKYKTFRLNVSVTAPYNADFDGDEMNAHIPQSYEASTELEEIAAVPHQILRPRDGKPVIGIVQDTLVGSFRLTRESVRFNRREFMNLMMWNKRFDGTIPAAKGERGDWTGHQVMSMLLPPINMDMDNSAKGRVIIREGDVVQGQFDKDIFSKASKGVIHVTFKDYGPQTTVNLIDSLQNTVEQFLVYNGFSVGISDLIADQKTKAEMDRKIQEKKVEIENLLLTIHQDLFVNNTGKTNQEEFENKVFGALNKATELAGETGHNSLANENRMTAMIRAGSKGGVINIAQMMACVGQQSIEGKRIPYGFSDRTLPHYKKYDDSAEARGFIESSFIHGLTPQQFFFHAMSGREGLIDTAVKSVTGDTPIVVLENGQSKTVRIGDWIDAHLSALPEKVEYFPEDANLELLQIPHEVLIQTCDDSGVISSALVTAVTRHDPGSTLYEVTTAGGRVVIVTAGKSLIVLNSETGLYTEKPMPEIHVGDFLPTLGSTKVAIPDPITQITQIDVRPGTPGYTLYPKMYDLTVPSTLNFALANGLIVRDTADTGYIQRQLVKAMEDLVVQNDGSVRDANMNITQFHYGEDGVNSSKVESQPLPLGKYSHAKLRAEFGLEGVDLSTVLADGVERGDDAAALEAYVSTMLAEQKQLVEGVYRFGRQSPVFAPVNIERILTSCKIQFGLNPQHRTNLTPAYVLAGIERVIQKTQPFNKMWSALLHYHLAPHTLIVKERFTESAFDALCEMLVLKNWQAWVQPGEQVGILAAQSIGEPSTQMCNIYDTFVVAHTKTKTYAGPIGGLIDSLLKEDPDNIIINGEDSVVLDLKEDIMIVGVSNDEKTSWRRISQVSRHPANGGLVEVHTRTGRKTTATLTHSFLKRSPAGIVPVLGSELRVGMRVPVAKTIPEVPFPTQFVVQGKTRFVLDRDLGWLCGIYLADGSMNGNSVRISKIAPAVEERLVTFCALYKIPFSVKHYQGEFGPGKDNFLSSKDLKDFLLETFKQGSYTKVVGPLVYHAPLEFIQGLVGGFFDGDGNINVDRQMIRASSRSRPLLEGINRLLGYCSMFGILGEETSIRMPDKIQYTLNIPKKFAKHYEETIGFSLPEKATALHEIVRYNDRDEIHDHKELIDKIPELGPVIAKTGKLLRMPGQSRTYGRWLKKESIGRRTLEEYVENFKEMLKIHVDPLVESEVRENIATMESALAADVFWDEIVDLVYLDDPKTYVYDFTVPGNDSFMVDDNILVHNTLNSVDWDTQIVISKNGAIVTPQIGEFIDDYYTNCSEETKIQRLPNDQIYIPLDDGNDWKAMSTDAHGNVTWTKLEAITRHPVVNEDGSNTILRVTLDSGRVVKATKGKSFLTMVDGLLTPTNGSELKVGDALPILNDLALSDSMIVDTLSLRDVLPATEYLYGSEVAKALAVKEAAGRHWFQSNQGAAFTVPYGRSDAFLDAFQHGRNSNASVIREGFVYPKRTRPDVSQIPETIPLTQSFGFFVGAYLAEGMSNATQICITNNDAGYLNCVKGLMDEWNVGTHRVCEERFAETTGIKGTTTSLIIHSTLLAKVMSTLFGRVSYEKTMPDWVLQAPDSFLSGLVDGYFCGDGTVEAKTGCVRATSCSKDLLLRMGALLARYGIFATYSERMPEQGNFQSVSMAYTMTLLAKYSQRFAKQFRLSIAAKQERLDAHFGGDVEEVAARQCRRASTNGVVWDTIQSIEEIAPMGEGWVYDLTVEGTRNFTSLDLVGHRDTFHLAGVASKSNVTRGVPRLKELLKVTHNPKATSLTIALKPEYRNSKEKAREVTQDLELTLLRDMTVRVAIYFDPKDSNTVVEEDKELIAFYKQFEQVLEQEQGGAAADPWSKWVLRLELDRQRMFDKNITMDDLMFILRQKYGDEIHTIYSDFNSQKLVMRIRIPEKFNTDELSSMDGLNDYKKFQNRLLNSILIRGVPGIKAVTFRKGEDRYQLEDGEYKTVQEYILDTDGSNFLEVMNHPAVDGTRLYSTHVHDVLPYLGVEAARAVLLNEMNTLFEEAGINYRHLGLLCDVMTRAGRFMSIDRYGINKMDIGPLAKASFEETERMLLRAAVFGEMDPITGVSANIMTGQPIRGGTSFSSILLDEAALLRVQKGLPAVVPLEGDEEGPTQEEVEKALYQETTDACATTSLRMNMTMPTATTFVEEPDIELQVLDVPSTK